MEKNEFIKSMSRIKATYGDQKYPPERETIIWLWAKKIPANIFNEICSELIAEFEYAPMIGKFKDLYSKLKPKFNHVQPGHDCPYCSGSGFILDDSLPGNVTACNCPQGERVPKYVARFTGTMKRVVPLKSELIKVDIKKAITPIEDDCPF